ncbi:MAG: 50S ribosomal protein L29 [Candidatus Aenigmatarchaeota archaeon]|nr:MAG: 50S ribosomal protein L29 [Candidatus Aenigmarchaeota archaeon]RLJ08939.1 MAG: 50S ribosomal protein L29 [Candidatus Aenigmarchaeota archaeon]RLJ09297.1 MAG: 50S ribosomal protein L29 [Candidatus Aenigmarchaeota archaeon]
MAVIKAKDVRKLNKTEREKKLKELRLEFAKEKANIKMGSSPASAGKLKEIKRTIARILTIQKEEVRKKK